MSQAVSTLPIPPDIRRELPDQLTPWAVSERLFKEMQNTFDPALKYRKCQVLPTDPEWRFVWRYFHQDKPTKYSIKRIFCIHERYQTTDFEAKLSKIEREADKFKPNWNQEPRADQRAVAIERWRECAKIFSPFNTIESDGRRHSWEKVKVLPLWHGTDKTICHSISESGFVYFGKTSIGSKQSEDPKSTDEGYFGSGIYFTSSARYAADIYGKGHLLMAWVSMREPFPVVGNPKHEDMRTLKGKGAYKHYNAHYVPVVSTDPSNPNNPIYFPCKAGQRPTFDEIVVFQDSQALGRFWVELEVDLPYLMAPSEDPRFVGELTPHILKILQNPNVDRDRRLRKTLSEKLSKLLQIDEDEDLEAEFQNLFEHLSQLIDQSGNVSNTARAALTGSSASSDKIAPLTRLERKQAIRQQMRQAKAIQKDRPGPPRAPSRPGQIKPASGGGSFKTPSSGPAQSKASSSSAPSLPAPPGSQKTGAYYGQGGPPQKSAQFTGANNSTSGYSPSPAPQFGGGPPSHSLLSPQTKVASSSSPPPSQVKKSANEQYPSAFSMAFGKAQWRKYFGDIGEEPLLPPNIEDILDMPCPFWATREKVIKKRFKKTKRETVETGKKVKNTHVLVLVPSHVNGNRLTLESLGELVKSPKAGGKQTKYDMHFGWPSDVNKEIQSQQSHWVLMTKDAIPKSGGKERTYQEQCELVQGYANKTSIPYDVPHLIDVAVCSFMRYVDSGEFMYRYGRTHCQDKPQNKVSELTLTIGSFYDRGLSIYTPRHANWGVGGAWRMY